MGAFVITKRFDEQYKYEFTSRKGKTIFTSNSFELKFECEDEIILLKEKMESCTYLKFKSSKNKYFFKLLLDDKHIATSRKYNTELRLQKGIEEIFKYGTKSEILDFSSNLDVFS